ncbi:hypothetical protein NDU88_002346 [Pleurodeles waltl]|uniref:Uncharacterized protein n=1 Tax=Pleurodeles waltl TaxID=8319 RepID=A0AAV7NHR6_PLEWA|nr:hypothetical protein NDU88_002346 [Pleurodeles waltl]
MKVLLGESDSRDYTPKIQLHFGEQRPGAYYFLKFVDQRLKETSPVTLEQNTARIPSEYYTCLFERTGEVPDAAVLKREEGSGFELCKMKVHNSVVIVVWGSKCMQDLCGFVEM